MFDKYYYNTWLGGGSISCGVCVMDNATYIKGSNQQMDEYNVEKIVQNKVEW